MSNNFKRGDEVSKIISVRVGEKLYEILYQEAQKKGLSLSKYIRRKLVESLKSEYKRVHVGKTISEPEMRKVHVGRVVSKPRVHVGKPVSKPKTERLILIPTEKSKTRCLHRFCIRLPVVCLHTVQCCLTLSCLKPPFLVLFNTKQYMIKRSLLRCLQAFCFLSPLILKRFFHYFSEAKRPLAMLSLE